MENETETPVEPTAAPKKKRAAKKTVKKAAAKKKAPAKKADNSSGRKGRTSAYTGKRIYKIVKDVKETGLRETGMARQAWDTIKEGMKVETYRETAPCGSGLARKALADFIVKKLVKVA